MTRWLVPEVVQTSAMDCGPACLAAIARGHGLAASYGRLREACQTDVDGTSIDTLEEIAVELGLDAQQVLVPVDHLLLPSYDAMPAIAITRLPTGATHFVVLWNRALGRIQVMDPARGRRWVSPGALADELYVHEMDLPAADWRAIAGTDELRGPLATRLRALGVAAPATLIDRALADPMWRPIAALDAATRMIAAVVEAGGLPRGVEAERAIDVLARDAARTDGVIPDSFWSARRTGEDDHVRIRGAVLVHVTGCHATSPRSPELAAAMAEPAPQPWRTLLEAVTADGTLRPLALALALLIAAAGVVAEIVLFRGLFEIGHDLVTVPQLAAALVALVVFLVAMLLVEVWARGEAARLGRHVEIRLRERLLAKLPRIGLHYLRSRPTSDMAERGHMLHRLRELPALGVRVVRATLEIIATALAIIWLAPATTPLAIALALAAIAPPLLGLGAIAERELRARTHAGALSRFYLDALLGTIPARASGIDITLRREHEGLLVEWSTATRREHRLAVAIAAIQAALGFGLAIALVVQYARGGAPATVLLLVYWALAIPSTGQTLSAVLRELPTYRNSTLRLLEPLGAIEDEAAAGTPRAGAATITAVGVTVVIAGRPILEELDISIAAGEHVAIVGPSGSGKSTFVGLLLGWARPALGTLRVDGDVLDAAAIATLRAATAWIDPAVTLWNEPLADNLTYAEPHTDIAAIAAAAGLGSVTGRLPEGLATRLGEGGGLVSGGEGQRVRIGRGLARKDPRLVVLDEPFRGLDRDSRGRQLVATRARWRNATLVCVTHDLVETLAFPRVLVIEGGRITEDGVPAALAARADSRYAVLLADEARAETAWARWQRRRLIDGRVEDAP